MDNRRYAFPLISVDRVIQAVAVETIPNSPPLIYGLFDFYGSLVPAINLRYLLNLPCKPISATDYFLVVDTPRRKLAMVIDEVDDVMVSFLHDFIPVSKIDKGLGASGFLQREDGLIVVYDLEAFISDREEDLIQKVIDSTSR
ncbi:MAG: chemotaxis protein CheW [Bacteroidales bacterium]|nr:chemotaxis protein CheW [Bacteroidales bacterium]